MSRQVPGRGRPLILLLAGLAAAAPSAQRGAALAAAARCGSCHGDPDGQPWAGGYAIVTRFGTFYGPNLTSDPETGLGNWTAADFTRAIREGRDPQENAYWPAFPYPSFTGLTETDIADLWAFFRSIPPVVRENQSHEPAWPWSWRGWLGPWRAMAFDPGLTDLPVGASGEGTRGSYLGTAVAHCGECHTPRGLTGGLRHRRELSGNGDPPAPAPNLTRLDWDRSEWSSFLSDGITPDGDVTGGEMRGVIRDGTRHLSNADRAAIGVWVEALPSRGRRPEPDEP